MRIRKWTAVAAAFFFAAMAAAGCSREAVKEPVQETETASIVIIDEVPGDFADGQGSGAAVGPGQELANGSGDGPAGGQPGNSAGESNDNSLGYDYPGWQNQTGNPEYGPGSEWEEDSEDGTFVQQKIVVATDLHYLAEELAGNRGSSFMDMVKETDGRVLQYGWEVLDAFLDDMLEERPDLVVLSGDLTLNGEKKSHEELAEKLAVLPEHGIEVAVIPGNHDINHPSAVKFTSIGTEKTENITAEEFAEIYSDYGYIQADSRDPNSLSYLYKLDDYYWLLMLDSCQYEPTNYIGGMIRRETYDWMEEVLEESWEQGAQVITVSHHNLLDQSGVSREFYDDCTIEHHEELLELLAGYEVRLHLSGHLHLQHYIQDEDYGIYEVVTGSLVMAPCHYGVLQIWNDGTLQYDARETDVDGWAVRNSYKIRDLADFKSYCENFLWQISYRDALLDLQSHIRDRKFYLSEEDRKEMAEFYAKLCVYYFGGRMHEIVEEVKKEPAYEKWNDIEYASDLSDFLENILEDDAKDFAHLSIPY